MKLKKTVLYHLNKCYAMTNLQYNGGHHFVVASEKEDKCLLFGDDGHLEDTIWEGPGGTMSMVQVPGTNGQFLAVQRFYSPNESEHAKIVVVTPTSGKWNVRTLVELPFVHRIDILQSGGVNYLIACALKSGHRFDEDWSMPGKVYAAQLPEILDAFQDLNPIHLEVVKDGMLKNHGYYRLESDGKENCVISCDSGVYQFFPPEKPGEKWKNEKLISDPASDAVMLDMDGDGEKELAVLSPYHGDTFSFYKKTGGIFQKTFVCGHKLKFIHALYGGILCGCPTVAVGHREGSKELLAFTYNQDKNSYDEMKLDGGCGPANLLHYVRDGKDVLIATNREIDEIAMYAE